MLKVYGADICKHCLAVKELFNERKIPYAYISIIENTRNMKDFLLIRDHEAVFEPVRNSTEGAIGIPLFVLDDRLSLELGEVLSLLGQEPISESDWKERTERMAEQLKNPQ